MCSSGSRDEIAEVFAALEAVLDRDLWKAR
jgi:hypothetical protein